MLTKQQIDEALDFIAGTEGDTLTTTQGGPSLPPRDDPPSSLEPIRLCAWCGIQYGGPSLPTEQGRLVTHGICAECFEKARPR